MSCKSFRWNLTLVDNSEVLEHRYAAKQHLVHSIWGTQKGYVERGMRKQRLTLDITHSNRDQVGAHVDMVQYHFIQSARDNIAEHYELHCFESDAEYLEFIDSLLADNKYHFPVRERMEGGVCSPNATEKQSKAANEWPVATVLPGGSNPAVHLRQISSLGK